MNYFLKLQCKIYKNSKLSELINCIIDNWFVYFYFLNRSSSQHAQSGISNLVHFPLHSPPLPSLWSTPPKVTPPPNVSFGSIMINSTHLGYTLYTLLIGTIRFCLVSSWVLVCAGRGRWVRSSSCTTSGSWSRCRSAGSGCSSGSGASTAGRPGPAAGTPAAGGGRGPRSCPTSETWRRWTSSQLWTSWRSSSSLRSHDSDWICLPTVIFNTLFTELKATFY